MNVAEKLREIGAVRDGPACRGQVCDGTAGATDPLDESDLVNDDDEITGIDDEDFWEALDLLETAMKSIEGVLTFATVSGARRKYLQNLTVDIDAFVNKFVEIPDKEDEK